MNFMLMLWLLLLAGFGAMSLVRPVWAVSAYLLTFFASPPIWWWGKPVASIRWNLACAVLAVGAVLLSAGARRGGPPLTAGGRRLLLLACAMLANATVVHFALAPKLAVSSVQFVLLAKMVVLFAVLVAAIRDVVDLRIFFLTILLGAGYVGFEATLNGRGKLVHNRLEGIGTAGATSANEVASLMVTVVPLAVPFVLAGPLRGRVIAVLASPLILNVLLMCNSRGAFLGAIASGVTCLVFSPPQIRRRIAGGLALGAVAVWFLLGDPRIVERFMTTFAGKEELDTSASERLVYWGAGLELIRDHPLGTGGHGFKIIYGPRYIARKGPEYAARAVHQGYISEACEWGVQGLLLRLAFLGGAAFMLVRSAREFARRGRTFESVAAVASLAGLAAMAVTAIFGDHLAAEWGVWIAASSVTLARLAARRDDQDGFATGQAADSDATAETVGRATARASG